MKARYKRFEQIIDRLGLRPRTVKQLYDDFEWDISFRQLQRDVLDLREMKLLDEAPSNDPQVGATFSADTSHTSLRRPGDIDYPHALATKLALDHARQIIAPAVLRSLEKTRGSVERILGINETSLVPWSEKVATQPLGMPLQPYTLDDAVFDAVKDALHRDRRLSFDYRKLESEPTHRVVDPLGLVSRPPRLYLVCVEKGDIKPFSLARMRNLTVLKDRAERPYGFKLAAYLETPKARFLKAPEPLDLHLRVSPDMAEQLAETPIAGAAIRSQGGEWQVHVQIPHTLELETFLLGWGEKVEVLGPQTFREHIANRIAEMASQYLSEPESRRT